MRDYVNTPAFLDLLPPVEGLGGLDIGCGEGANTRTVAKLGARMTGVDIAQRFIAYARQAERDEPLGIHYAAGSGTTLPCPDASFDFAVAFMSLMDMANADRAVAEAFRVVRPGGFFQFSILHPCFHTSGWQGVNDDTGKLRAIEVGGYFDGVTGDLEEWTFSRIPEDLKDKLPPFRIPRFWQPLSAWFNMLIDAGFVVDRMVEPCPTEEQVRAHPFLAQNRVIAWFLIIRCRKPVDSPACNK